ncbi:MAG: hypothetical protein ACRD6X_15890 [Pyrinomonadaceae bacterium]
MPETYCRQCGTFFPDLDKLQKKETPVEEHIRINTFFTVATAVVSLTLAIILYFTFINNGPAPIIIYPVFGFLIAMTAWQVQTFIRTRMLRKQFKKLRPARGLDKQPVTETGDLLPEANLENIVPASITERTTRNLAGEKVGLSKTEQ